MLPITSGAETYIKSKAGYSRNNLSVKKKKVKKIMMYLQKIPGIFMDVAG